MRLSVFAAAIFLLTAGKAVAQDAALMHEQHRLQFHFSPQHNWINDPNGMLYYKGVYHLFYQHYPEKPVWGPMHWGHATSSDLVHWTEKPIALYPDSLGYIFSGSAVVDENNTSGLGSKTKPPLVAIFTYHKPDAPAGSDTFQYQGIAYSNDNGNTWTKYAGNPVLRNPGIADFRDPKVFWYTAAKKWVMTLATKDRVSFYSSPDLKQWKKESEFGADKGAHGGVWECPDLFPLSHKGKNIWVLLVNMNPGAPNGGSGTQYFLGDFDGHQFTTSQKEAKWMDYGPDNYAGVTWSNTGNRRILIGWMSNWNYAQTVPTSAWRNALTVPRELLLKEVDDKLLLVSKPVKEIEAIHGQGKTIRAYTAYGMRDLQEDSIRLQLPCRIGLQQVKQADFLLRFSNEAGEVLAIGYHRETNEYYIDRTGAGASSFNKDFATTATAPRFQLNGDIDLELLLDKSSVEIFADGGLTVMTAIFFPATPYQACRIEGDAFRAARLDYFNLQSIWDDK